MRGVTSDRVNSLGAGQIVEGGTAEIVNWTYRLADTANGLVIRVMFDVVSRSGDPYLKIPRAGVVVDGERA
jgi:hypothetical protein